DPPLARQLLALGLRPRHVFAQPRRRRFRLLRLLAARTAQAVLGSLRARLAERLALAALPPPRRRGAVALVLAGLPAALRGHGPLPVLLALLARPALHAGIQDHAVLAHRVRAVRRRAHQC